MCGLSRSVRKLGGHTLQWIKPSYEERCEWRKWFAWHPVRVRTFRDGAQKWVWLETVLTKLENDGWDLYWAYKELDEV